RERLAEGRAPSTDPKRKWYDSDDARFLTIADFEEFCAEKGYKIFRKVALDAETGVAVETDENLNADVAIVVLGR
ncbi:MAG: hypothetical protein IJ387_11725, partial [Thermoguttaceae bacterium]|nr:hypothetical protein [Thermoguttaceae bacterium]